MVLFCCSSVADQERKTKTYDGDEVMSILVDMQKAITEHEISILDIQSDLIAIYGILNDSGLTGGGAVQDAKVAAKDDARPNRPRIRKTPWRPNGQ